MAAMRTEVKDSRHHLLSPERLSEPRSTALAERPANMGMTNKIRYQPPLLVGTAANQGNEGNSPKETPNGVTAVSWPSAKPGPNMYATAQVTMAGNQPNPNASNNKTPKTPESNEVNTSPMRERLASNETKTISKARENMMSRTIIAPAITLRVPRVGWGAGTLANGEVRTTCHQATPAAAHAINKTHARLEISGTPASLDDQNSETPSAKSK